MATTRRRVTRGRRPDEDRPFPAYVFTVFGGLSAFTADAHPADEAEARRYWPRYRRAAWLGAHHGAVPVAAALFDGITASGADAFMAGASTAAVRAALAADRQALDAFGRRVEARALADVFALVRASFDRLVVALDALDAGTPWAVLAPRLNPTGTYGDVLDDGEER